MKVRLLALLFALVLVAGLPLAASAGPATGSADSDADGVDDDFDNCLFVQNADQVDTNHDGCGDACTAPVTCDGTGDTVVGSPDFVLLIANYGNNCNTSPELDCRPDCNSDDIVGAPDFSAMFSEYGNKTGPSGITTVQCMPGCACTPQ